MDPFFVADTTIAESPIRSAIIRGSLESIARENLKLQGVQNITSELVERHVEAALEIVELERQRDQAALQNCFSSIRRDVAPMIVANLVTPAIIMDRSLLRDVRRSLSIISKVVADPFFFLSQGKLDLGGNSIINSVDADRWGYVFNRAR